MKLIRPVTGLVINRLYGTGRMTTVRRKLTQQEFHSLCRILQNKSINEWLESNPGLRGEVLYRCPSRESPYQLWFEPDTSRIKTLDYGTRAAILQNVPVGRSVLCEQENYFLKLMVQWWVPVNDDVMEWFVLDVILCKHWDRPAKSNNSYSKRKTTAYTKIERIDAFRDHGNMT
jgi:hypothetical protein